MGMIRRGEGGKQYILTREGVELGGFHPWWVYLRWKSKGGKQRLEWRGLMVVF